MKQPTHKKPPEKRALRKNPQKNSVIFNSSHVYSANKSQQTTVLPNRHAFFPLGAKFMKSLAKQNRAYHYQSNSSQGNFADIEAEYIEIKPVAALQEPGQTAYWGAFAKKEIRGPIRLGEYFGCVTDVPKEGSKKEKKLSNHEFYNSFQLSATKALVPEEKEEFWPRKANCAPCEQVANIVMQRSGNRVFYAVPPGVIIPPGHQLLPFYGEEYSFESKVFLNPTDTDEESSAKLKNYTYETKKIKLEPRLLEILGIENSPEFSKPSIRHLSEDTVNLPLLAHGQRGQVLPQKQQENPTLLHLACWMGRIQTCHTLTSAGANLNQYTRKTGLTPIHAIVLSPHYRSTAEKMALIAHLKAHGASLLLQDEEEQSVLHLAIQTKQFELANYLLTLERDLTSLVNEDEQDFFLYAISTGSAETIEALAPAIPPKFLSTYVNESDSLVKALKKLRRTLPSRQFERLENTVMKLCEDKKPTLYEQLLEHFNPTSHSTHLNLSC